MNSISRNGISVCPTGEEKYVYFNVTPRLKNKGRHCQFDYRHTDDTLFSIVATTLEKCREKRDKWLKDKIATKAEEHRTRSECRYYTPASYAVCSTCKIGGYCHRVCDKFQK